MMSFFTLSTRPTPFVLLLFFLAFPVRAELDLVLPLPHSDGITRIVISPNVSEVATASYDQTVKLWDLETGALIRTFNGHQDIVEALAFSPDGKLLASGGEDEKVVIWEVLTGDRLVEFEGHDDIVLDLLFSPDGRELYVAGEHYFHEYIRVLDVETGEQLRLVGGYGDESMTEENFTGHVNSVHALEWATDGSLISAGSDYYIKSWDPSSDEEVDTQDVHEDEIKDLAVSSTGVVVTGSEDGEVIFWDWNTRSVLYRASEHDDWIEDVAISEDGRIAASSDASRLIVWDVQNQGILREFEVDSEVTAISPDGRFLLVDNDGKLQRISIADGSRQDLTPTLVGDEVYASAWNASASTLYLGMTNGFLNTWDFRDNHVFSSRGGRGFIRSLEIGNVGESIVVASYDLSLVDPDTDELRVIESWEDEAKTDRAASYLLTRSEDGENVYMVTSLSARLVNQAQGTLEQTPVMIETLNGVRSASVSESHGLFAVTTEGFIAVYGLSSGERLYYEEERYPESMRLGPKSGRLYLVRRGASGDRIEVRDRVSFDVVTEINSQLRFTDGLTLSSDEKTLAIIESNSIELIDIESPEKRKILGGHEGAITDVRFIEDDRYLLSTAFDGSTRLWDVASGRQLVQLISFDSGKEWLAVTPEGLFDGTEGAMKQLYFVSGLKTLPVESFFEDYFTPRLLARVLSGENIKAPGRSLAGGFSMPPSVIISSPERSATYDTDQLKVVVEATDQGGGIDEIRLYHNGKRVSTEQRGLQVAPRDRVRSMTFTVTLIPGENEFRATAFSNSRVESVPAVVTVQLGQALSSARLFVIAVGLSEYRNSVLNLNYGRPDAEAFVSEIRRAGASIFSGIEVFEIYDSNATYGGIVAAFKDVIERSRPEDLFVFYYAGHGVMTEPADERPADFYMVPHDVTQLYGNPMALQQKGLSASQLKAFAAEIPALKQLVFLDACQSGGAVQTFAMRGAAEQKAIAQLSRSTGQVVLAAAGSEQYATEFDALGHGVFTYALLEGIRGAADGANGDGKITINELSAFLEDRVPVLTQKHRGQSQYPNRYGFGQDFPIGLAR